MLRDIQDGDGAATEFGDEGWRTEKRIRSRGGCLAAARTPRPWTWMMVAPAAWLSRSLRFLSLASLGDSPRRPARLLCPSAVGGKCGRASDRVRWAGGPQLGGPAGGVDFLGVGSAGGG